MLCLNIQTRHYLIKYALICMYKGYTEEDKSVIISHSKISNTVTKKYIFLPPLTIKCYKTGE